MNMSKFNPATELDEQRFKVTSGVPNKRKKITGTRFSKVIGCNEWASDFQAWCEIMKVAEPPFEGNKYTEAGQAIESKLIDYAREQVSPYIQEPEAYFETDDAKKKMFYDFFRDDIFGGMWDGLPFDRSGVTETMDILPLGIIECKTTSRPQDWMLGVPDNYKAQGLLYAALMDLEDVYFPVAFLEPEDYDHPEEFVCTDDNTRVYHITIDEPVGEFENIYAAIKYAEEWYKTHIDGNLSPVYNDRKDKEYLTILRQCSVSDISEDVDETDFDTMLSTLFEIDSKINELEKSSGLEELKKLRKEVNARVQALVKPVLGNVEGKDSLDTEHYVFKVSPSKVVDYKALEEDGLTDLYVTMKPRITTKLK